MWKRLGAEVTILEALPDFLAVADAEVSKVAAREFKRELDIRLGAKVSKTEVTGKGKKKKFVVTYTDKDGEQTLTVDKLLVAVGRRREQDLARELNGNGGCSVKLDSKFTTSQPGHYHGTATLMWEDGGVAASHMGMIHDGATLTINPDFNINSVIPQH